MRRRVLGIVALSVLLLGPPSVAAKPDAPFDPHAAQRGFGVRDSRSARFALEEARRAIENDEVLVGLRSAQRVLDRMQDDFFLQAAKSSPESILWQSAAEVAREILAELTPAQREIYEDLVSPSAEPLIASALESRDLETLEIVLRRFGASKAGIRAARLLTAICMEAGRWRDAARYAREGLRFVPTDRPLWRRVLTSLAATRERSGLQSLRLPDVARKIRLEIDGKTDSLEGHRTALIEGIPRRPELEGWPMWGGAPGRARTAASPPPVPTSKQWSERLAVAERRLDRQRAYFGNNTTNRQFRELVSLVDPVHPVAVGRTVYAADGRGVRAYDIFTGRAVWRFNHVSAPNVPLFADDPHILLPGRSSLERAFSPVVASGRVVATVEWLQEWEGQRLQQVVIDAFMPRRGIVVLDQNDGTLLWRRLGHGDLALFDAMVVSPPVVAEGLVIALISQYNFNHNVSMVAFDLETGALRWQRALGFGQQELNLFGYPTKELAGSAVAARDGVAYASTGLGFVAAVDIRSGIPRWLASYEPIEIRPVEYWYEAPVRRPRVGPSPPMIHGDKLVLAPTDSLYLHVFNRHTGELVWRQRHDRREMRSRTLGQVLGIANDGKRDVVVVTDRAVRALDLKTGKTAWVGRFMPEAAEVRGRGMLAGDVAVVPTRAGLQRFSISAEGKFVGRHPWPSGSASGNVLATGQALLVAARDKLISFYEWEDIEANAERRLREHPDDPSALLEAGELYLRGRQIDRALDAFTRALPLAQKTGKAAIIRARLGLLNTWLTTSDLAEDATQALTAARKALAFADTRDQRIRVHLAMHGLEALDLATRIDNLQELARIAGDAEAVFDEPERGREPVRALARLLIASMYRSGKRPANAIDALQDAIRDDAETVVRGETVTEQAQRTIDDIIRIHGRDVYKAHDAAARAMYEAAKGDEGLEVLNRLLELYPNAGAVSDALGQRARRRMAKGEATGAADDLRRLIVRLDGQTEAQAQALAMLHEAWRAAGATGAAQYVATVLGEAYADTPFTLGEDKLTGAAFAKQNAAPPTTAEDPGLTPPLRELLVEPAPDEQQMRAVEQRDDPSAGAAPLRFVFRERMLMALDLRAGATAWQVPCRVCRLAGWSPYGIVTASGRYGRDLEGRNEKTGEVTWTVPLGRYILDLALANGQVFALTREMNVRRRVFHLEAFDIPTGQRLWTRPLGDNEHRGLGTWRHRVYVERRRLEGGRSMPSLRIFEGLRGRHIGEVRLPATYRATSAVFDGYVVAAKFDPKSHEHRVEAWSLIDATKRWSETLEGKLTTESLAPAPDGQVVVLRSNGDLLTLDVATGETAGRTRIFVSDRGRTRPYPGTAPYADRDLFILVPPPQRGARLAAYERKTGKLAWDVMLSDGVNPSRIVFGRAGNTIWVLTSRSVHRQQTNQVLLVDLRTGKRIQALEPAGLSGTSLAPEVTAGHGSLVLVGRKGATVLGTGR